MVTFAREADGIERIHNVPPQDAIEEQMRVLRQYDWEKGRTVSRRTDTFNTEAHFRGWVEAGVRAIANGVASCQIILKGQEGDLPAHHPMHKLFQHVNDDLTYFELMARTIMYLEVHGNAYWWKARRRLSRVPGELMLLPPAYVRVIPGSAAPVAGYLFRRRATEIRLAREDVVHFKYSVPHDPFYGKGTVEALTDSVIADGYLVRSQRQIYEQGPHPSAILTTAEGGAMTPIQIERMRVQFENRYRGMECAGKLMIAPFGTKLEAYSSKAADMDFREVAKGLRDRILGCLGVPAATLGLFSETQNATAVKAAAELFAHQTLMPRLSLLASRITQDLAPDFLPDDIIASFTSPIPRDRDADRKDVALLLASDAITSKEAVGMLGLTKG